MRIWEYGGRNRDHIIWGVEDKNLDLYGLPNLLESACPFTDSLRTKMHQVRSQFLNLVYDMCLLCVIGSLGSVLLFGQRENQHWPGRQSLQGEGRKLIQNCVFECCVFLYFVFSCSVSVCCVFPCLQITPTFCNAMATFTSALDCALCEVSKYVSSTMLMTEE